MAHTSLRKRLSVILLLAGVAAVVLYVTWSSASPQTACAGCHEIESSSVSWAMSGHRDFHCRECHGTALSNGLHSLTEKAMMVVRHYAGPGPVRLNEAQVLEVMAGCRRCHGAEYARWISGGHSATYASIFLNRDHNSREQPGPDCLRCHGMFFEGTIGELVTPLNTTGPWKLARAGQDSLPVIPCLACHRVHREGLPAARADYADPKKIFYAASPAVSTMLWYDRYEKTHIDAAHLPALRLAGDSGSVRVADDARERVCVQCHAPDAFHRAGSGDDRTPRGVHEGLSCLACHENHSNESRRSCANCHPALSSCGIDVTTMNTTFHDPRSPNNIHFVRCADCHARGVPAKGTPQPNTLTEAERKEGWKLLFDGVSMSGWRGAYLDSLPAKGWKVENGELIVEESGGREAAWGGDLVTEEQYGSFELKVDFKLTKGANSGIKIFVTEQLPRTPGSAKGLEYQLLDDANHPDAKLGINGNRTLGSLYDLMPASHKQVHPIGEWNHARIVVKGKHVEHWLNGVLILAYERGGKEFLAHKAVSKFKDLDGFGEAPRGHILLQDHGDMVSFRNIKIRTF